MKKRKRYLIAGLAMIAVTAASTMAYFTSTATIGDTNGGSPLQLNITNGNVEITANPGTGTTTPNWTYDVARTSTTDYDKFGDGLGTVVAGITSTAAKATDVKNYENKHRSMDMVGLGGAKDAGRWPIGAPVTGAVTLARPGDTFVMGTAVAGGDTSGANTGLNIKNTSDLTVKVQLKAMRDLTALATFSALSNGGWKLYVGGIKADGTTIIPISEITDLTDATGLQAKLDAILPTTDKLLSNEFIKLNIRLELPLTAGNAYNSTSTPISVSGFNLNNLFTIKATQENNPGWNVDGTE